MINKMLNIVMQDEYLYFKEKLEGKTMSIEDLKINVEGKREHCLIYLIRREVLLKETHKYKIIAKITVLDAYDVVDNYYAIPDVRVKVEEVVLERKEQKQ
jgi:hypothetical protein